MPWAPKPRSISLDVRSGDRFIAGERQLMEMLTNHEDPVQRELARRHLNACAASFSETLLSSAGLFPDTQTQGVPSAVRFGEADRLTIDIRWRMLFDVQDRRSQTSPYFKITDVYDAVEFKVYQLGERIEIRHVEGNQEIYEAEVIAGGLQWNRMWEHWQDLWSAGDGIASMNAKYARKMSKLALQVLTASGLETTAYQAGGDTLERDILTINAAITEIGNEIYQTEGIEGVQTEEDIEGATYYLLFNSGVSGYEGRITRALGARYTLPNTNSVLEVSRPVVPMPSRDVPAGGWYLVLPGRKLVAAVFKDLEIYDFMDPRIAGVADGRVGQGAYKMVRGDSRQVRKLALS